MAQFNIDDRLFQYTRIFSIVVSLGVVFLIALTNATDSVNHDGTKDQYRSRVIKIVSYTGLIMAGLAFALPYWIVLICKFNTIRNEPVPSESSV
ncbi:uncharacterized protein SCDLUD_002285 [Saccharomycodes ludwigii]|uniref:uncharacterized protein n=1 Tax=Saccharomycodes ludwigii TaxID=36035 RepID=UPI001E869F33|nr:hypothetical protein SCDLUD_002285 [Saccharomycodes ludwigii]KAH3900832.1 hypothetical protein SCDLUD_002285 [Saccharomycodes ludwigii]